MDHYEILINLIKENKSAKIMEVGVHASKLTKAILRNKECFDIVKEYWGCDPFLPWYEMRGDRVGWDNLYLYCCRLARWYPQHHIIRATSVEGAKLFPNNYFDFVYIDADHSYDAVKLDILTWFPKIKKGGILAGHDYTPPELGKGKHPGVAKAVNDIFKEDIEILGNTVWKYIVKA